MADKSLKEICEDRAKKGDGAYAIAAAIFDLSESQEATARALYKLGLADAATPMGALENLALQLQTAGESISQSVSEVAQQIGELSLSAEK